ncbi:SAM and SH3 domain-containing protein 1, partial [Habropoda laboriosa]
FVISEQGQNPSKKKTTFSRLLRGLKTHRKEKQAQTQGSPRHGRARMGVPQRVDTPDSVLQSGLGLGPDMGHTILRSMVDPRDYDRLRYLQMNGGQPNSFEETIHRHLSPVETDLSISPWVRLPHYDVIPPPCQLGNSRMGGMLVAHGGLPKVCFTLNLRSENRGEGVISLRTAGDISLPRDRSRKGATSMMRGLIVPQGHNNPPAIIPLTHSRASRESGDYASSDVQSRSSGEEGLSPSQSSDYEDQEELENQHSAAVHTSEASALLEGDARAGVAGRARNLRHDVQRKISRLRQDRASSEAFPCSASSVESLPSGSGSSTQALVRAGSNHSSISYEDRDAISPTSIGPVLCRARALVDYTPSPYDKEALKFKKGDIIDVIQMNKSGLWKGVLHSRIGHFKFINVEILNDRVPRRGEPEGRGKWGQRYRQKPGSVQELLQRMNLQEHIPVFVLNGYEDLELFREIEPADLDYLRIHQPEHRAKILTAVQLLHELQSGSEGELASSSEGDEVSRLVLTSGQTSGHCSPFNRRQFPRDSGCYDAHKNPTSRRTVSPESATSSKLPRENNLDATAPTKNVSGIGTEGGAVSDGKDDFHPNIPITGNVTAQKEGQFDKSPLLRSGNVRFIAKRGNFGETVVIEDACESGQKLGGVAKYVVGSSDLGLEGTGNVAGLGQRGCLSEKSSDSGVSSSSISSAPPPRDKVLANVALDSPTKNFSNFTRASPTSQAANNKNQTGEASYE